MRMGFWATILLLVTMTTAKFAESGTIPATLSFILSWKTGISGEKCTKRFCKYCLGNLWRHDLAMKRTFKLPDIRPLWKVGYRIYTDDRQSTGFLGCQLSFYNGKIYIFNVRPVADIRPDTGYQQRTVIRSIPLAKNYLYHCVSEPTDNWCPWYRAMCPYVRWTHSVT